MKTIKCSAILFFVAVLLLFSTAFAFANEVAVLTSTKGRVDILKPGMQRAVPIEMGASLLVGDIIRTKSDSKAELTFIDGSVIRLAQSTRLEITTYLFDEKGNREESILKLFRGKVRALVSKGLGVRSAAFGKGSKYEIHTPNAVAGVRGTDFFTLYWRGITSVVFVEESGYTYNLDNSDQIVIVSAGESTVIVDDNPPQPAKATSDGQIEVLINDTSPEAQTEEEDDSTSETEDDASADTGTQGTSSDGEGEGDTGSGEGEGDTEGTGDDIAYSPPEDAGTTVEDTIVVIEDAPPITTVETTDPVIIEEETVVVVFEDTVAPITSNTSKAYIEPVSGLTTLSFTLSSNEPVSYSYNLEGVTGTSTTGDISFSVLAEGNYTFDYTATDAGGNTDSDSLSFDLSLNTLTGSASGIGSLFTGSVTGDVVSVLSSDWGGWLMELSGAYTGPSGSSWDITAGGDAYNSFAAWDGFWLNRSSGTYGAGSTLSGTSNFTYLTTTTLGTGTGVVEGTYDDGGGTWQATNSSSSSTYTETPLVFGGVLITAVDAFGDPIGNFASWDPVAGELSWSGYASGLIGGTDTLWTGSPDFVALGTYSNPDNEGLWSMELLGSTSDGETYYGSMGGITLNDTLEGMAGALYVRPDGAGGFLAGYLTSYSFAADLYLDLGMWSKVSGDFTTTDMFSLSSAPTLYGTRGVGTLGGDITGSLDLESIFFLIDENLGITWMKGGGSYTATPSINWTADIGGHSLDDLDNIDLYWMGDVTGSDWSTGRLAGTIGGTFMGERSMGSFTADMLGTYDGISSGNWQATSFGTYSLGPQQGTSLAFGGGIQADISHRTRRYTGSYSYDDSSSYWHDYFKDNTWGSGYSSVTGDFITYRTDGTTETCGSSGCTYSLWDPAIDDLSLLLATPAGNITFSYITDNPFMNISGSMTGLIGGTGSLWSGGSTPVTIMGEYSDYYTNSVWASDDIYSTNHDNYTYTTYDGGAYYGFTGGIKYNDSLEGGFLALYIDPAGNAGLLRTDLTGTFYPDSGMWDAYGNLTTVEMGSTTVLPSNLFGTVAVNTTDSDEAVVNGVIAAGGSMTGSMDDGSSYSISDQDWGIFRIEADGTYTGGATSGALDLSTKYTENIADPSIVGFEGTGTWSTSDNNFNTTGLGYGAEGGGDSSTWISVGDTFGTFNADALTWESVMTGVYMDVDRLLQMACPSVPCSANPQELQDLNIPAIEVGRVTLSGSGNGFTDLSMTDTIFFAYSNGLAPKVWASGDVSGNYTAPPVIDTAIALSGGGLSADFIVKDWDTASGNWLSDISGTGGFNGSTSFTGAGSGTGATAGSGSITGTAAGLSQ